MAAVRIGIVNGDTPVPLPGMWNVLE
jgi:hypothetical protein